MAKAICFKCGADKSGALLACRGCGATPRSNSEFAVSLSLSEHLSSPDTLARYSNDLRNGRQLSVPRETLLQALEALKDPQLLSMLGAEQPAASKLGKPAAPSVSIAVRDSAVLTQTGALLESVGIETLGNTFTGLLLKGSKLPCTVAQVFSTAEDGQDQLKIHLCVGDEAHRRVSYSLGKFQISGISPMPKGKPSIAVQFTADLNGISLKVSDNHATSILAIADISPVTSTRQSTDQRVGVSRTAPPPIPSKPVARFSRTALHQSPFALLGATIRDDRRRIVELAEEKSLELDHDVCQKARSDLTNPRTRLNVEISWLPGVSPRKAMQLLDGLLHDPMAIRGESGLPTLAHLNVLAAAFESVDGDHDADDLAEFIQEMAYLVEDLSPDDVLSDINADRSVSGFPEVKSVDQIEAELNERKRYYRNTIKEALDRLPSAKLVQVMTETVDGSTIGGEDHAPGLIDDLVDSYEVETQGPLQSGAENILKLIQAARHAAPSGDMAVRTYVDKILAAARSWDRIAQPIQLSAKARGIEHEASSSLGWAIRSLAIDLFNTHDMLDQSQRLTSLLKELFSEIPEISERVDQDADALDEIATDRSERAERLNAIFEKFKDFGLTETTFAWKNRTYSIDSICHITFFRSVTTHKTNFVETGKTEKAILTLALDGGQNLNMSIDEQGMFWNKDLSKQIQSLAEFYGFLLHVTFDRRLQFYEDQIEERGYWVYDECYFYPGQKVVFRGKEFPVRDSSFLRSYGCIEMRKKDFGVLDKLKREVSLTKVPQFSTLTDTDVIFHLLKEHMGLSWGNS